MAIICTARKAVNGIDDKWCEGKPGGSPGKKRVFGAHSASLASCPTIRRGWTHVKTSYTITDDDRNDAFAVALRASILIGDIRRGLEST
jgi:hypothetical protein